MSRRTNHGKSRKRRLVAAVPRCWATEVAERLKLLAAGEAFLADRPWQQIWWGVMRLDLVSGWRLEIWIERDQLGSCQAAVAPDGRDWIHGCQRDDWTLGPDAKVLDPMALLSAPCRLALEQRLRAAICWPPPALCGPAPLVSLTDLQRVSSQGRSKVRRSRPGRLASSQPRRPKPAEEL